LNKIAENFYLQKKLREYRLILCKRTSTIRSGSSAMCQLDSVIPSSQNNFFFSNRH